jgi:hypothetical protein
MICSAPRELTDAEYAAALEELGMTAQEVSQPTRLELLVEFEMGRMGDKEYQERKI